LSVLGICTSTLCLISDLQYIKHSKYRQDSETSNYCFYKSVS
jgi:hypothetical protein